MNTLIVIAQIVSLTLLGAHFLRDGAWPLVAACIGFALLLAWRTAWARRLVQAALLLGTIEWGWTALVLVQERMAEGRPWIRLAAILAGVALFTAASALAPTMGRSGLGSSAPSRPPG